MKKTLISLFVIGIITLFTAGAYAKWVLYDNFDSYDNIDDMKASGKWFISPESEGRANFSIVDGRLRIQHFLNKPQASAWAQIIEESYKLKGIKVTIEVESWDGDTRVRIGADIGTLRENPDHLVWYSMALRHRWADWIEPEGASMEYVRGYAVVGDFSEGWNWQYDIFYTELGAWKRPTLVDIPHTIIAEFDQKNIKYTVKEPDNLGKVKYKFTEKIDELEYPFRGIGTRTNNDEGTCVVYFDDVYVRR